jgi:hypothetical protein
VKRAVGQKAGDKFAKQGEQRLLDGGPLALNSKKMEQKTVEMKDEPMEKNHSDAATIRGAVSEELFDLGEWEALLDNFDSTPSVPSTPRIPPVEPELSSDDLWERLSSTRWVRTPSRTDHNDSTVAHRPSA